MQLYVLGFLFDEAGERVALIKRNRPEPAHLVGKLNGIGGHVEPGEAPVSAMQREFLEETGVALDPAQWAPFASYGDRDGTERVYCYRAFSDAVRLVRTVTDEPVRHVAVARVAECDCAPNLLWLIHMALTRTVTATAVER